MESPVFKLEKVVHSRSEEMQDFEGPLDLILFLLSKNKIEIQDIPIALILDQYLEFQFPLMSEEEHHSKLLTFGPNAHSYSQ